MSNALTLEDVHIQLAGNTIVDHISLNVVAGDVVGIIGPNGGGKSTLLKAVLGLIPYKGVIQHQPDARFGYVPQYFDFDRTIPLTVRELFTIRRGGLLWSRAGKRDSRERLAAVGAEHTLDRRLGVLSGGELQRVLIALALVNDPTIVVLDEPSASIDMHGEEQIFTLITDLAKVKGFTVLFVSHDVHIIERFATKVLCINRSLACYGPAQGTLTPEIIASSHGTRHTYRHHDAEKGEHA